MAINPISSLPAFTPIQSPGSAAGGSAAGAGKFQDALAEAVGRVEQYRQYANLGVERFLAGEGEDLHSVALQTQRAELAFEMFLQVRNKVVEAYQEVMRMQV